jgi:hypothetical protein
MAVFTHQDTHKSMQRNVNDVITGGRQAMQEIVEAVGQNCDRAVELRPG